MMGDCGTDYVQIKGIQHWDITGYPSDLPDSEPINITNSLLLLLLSQS
jgi:hypothetical protein